MISTGLLNKPVLYVSDFFEKNRLSYYDSLAMVKKSDNMTQWLKFFLNGIVETAKSSIVTFDKITKLSKRINKKLENIGKKAINGKKLVQMLYSQPKINAKTVAEKLGISFVSANSLLKTFVEIGILEEKTGFNRNRYYVFEEYIKIFR